MVSICKKEMQEMFGHSTGQSLYGMCLQKFHTKETKLMKGSFVRVNTFDAVKIMKFMDLIKPKTRYIALWQRDKQIIKDALNEMLRQSKQ